MLEPEGGVIMARRAVQTLTAELSRKGVLVRRGRAGKPSAPGRVSTLGLMDGTTLPGDVFVFACGAWLPAVFPELLGQRIIPTRQAVVYFGTPPGDERFAAAHTPAWVDFAAGIYGVPDLEGRGLKVGIDTHGTRFDPDAGIGASTARASTRLARGCDDDFRAWQRRLSSKAACVSTRAHQRATSSSIVTRTITTSGSSAAVPVMASSMDGRRSLCDTTDHDEHEPEAVFSLETKGTVAQRAVY